MSREQYYLPNQEWTTSAREYSDAWKALGQRVERMFPGYRVAGFDPNLRLEPIEQREFHSDGFTLPVRAALALVDGPWTFQEVTSMGLYTNDREELTLVIDTDSYSGNFEREMFMFITGRGDTPDGATNSNMEHYRKLAEAGWFDEVLDDLLDARVNDPGDDGVHVAYVTIAPTPGFFNDGKGVHFPDSEKLSHKHKGKRHHPAFQSVALFLQRAPTPDELAHIKKRAYLFTDLPKKSAWDSRPKILGFRLLRAKTSWSSEAL